jgi:BTB/POZ domain
MSEVLGRVRDPTYYVETAVFAVSAPQPAWLIVKPWLIVDLIFVFLMTQVENTLYRVPKVVLTRESPVFDGMFSVESQLEGRDDDHPIVLEGYKSHDFGHLLKLLMPEYVYLSLPRLNFDLISTASPLAFSIPLLSKEEWTSVLKLSTIWQMAKVTY